MNDNFDVREVPRIVQQEHELDELLQHDYRSHKLLIQAFYGALSSSSIRSLFWRICLGALTSITKSTTINTWIKEAEWERDNYCKLCGEYFLSRDRDDEDGNVKVSNSSDDDNDDGGAVDIWNISERYTINSKVLLKPPNDSQTNNDPLTLDATSPWSQFHEDSNLKKRILQDVERLFPDIAYFQSSRVLVMLERMLFVYVKRNLQLGYCQGMHELAAVILYVMDRDTAVVSNAHPISVLFDRDWVEADAYFLFTKLMKTTEAWFHTRLSMAKANIQAREADITPLLQMCQHIHHNLLRSADKELYLYLTSINIDPQLYLLRWVRLLLSREFDLDDTLKIWDVVFAYDEYLTLLQYIAVAMLLQIKDQIMNRDNNGVLQLLFNYPKKPSPVLECIYLALKLAPSSDSFVKVKEIMEQKGGGISDTSPIKEQRPTSAKENNYNSIQLVRRKSRQVQKSSNASTTVTANANGSLPNTSPSFNEKEISVLAQHLSQCIKELNETRSSIENKETEAEYQKTLDKLGKVRDVLCGNMSINQL